eukprot:COSAG02_NODE_557_length_20379_cov_6.688215_8_plen_143_part_00
MPQLFWGARALHVGQYVAPSHSQCSVYDGGNTRVLWRLVCMCARACVFVSVSLITNVLRDTKCGFLCAEPEVRTWDPLEACKQPYPITTFQPVYYAAESFADARERMIDFTATINRPFDVRYNAHSQRIEFDRNVQVAPPRD